MVAEGYERGEGGVPLILKIVRWHHKSRDVYSPNLAYCH